jgi:hypothetical protein
MFPRVVGIALGVGDGVGVGVGVGIGGVADGDGVAVGVGVGVPSGPEKNAFRTDSAMLSEALFTPLR